MQSTATTTTAWQHYTHPREGTVDLKPLASGEVAPGVGYFFLMARYGADGQVFATPRHRHTFHQIRYVVEGSINYARGKDIPQGWVGYFPAGTWYGPQHVASGTMLGVQFGDGYLTEHQKAQAQQELGRRGTFCNGIYTTADPDTGKKTNKDGMQAMWEHAHGQPLNYPPPRYAEPILTNPAASCWTDTNVSGIHERHLGTFTEHLTRITELRWDRNADLRLSPARTQLVYSTRGTLRAGGASHPAQTAIASDIGEETVLAGESGTHLLLWELQAHA